MKVTAVVPSYEPDEKLIQVVDGLLAAGFDDIVVVNDGSHEGHLQTFAEAASRPGVTVLTHEAEERLLGKQAPSAQQDNKLEAENMEKQENSPPARQTP